MPCSLCASPTCAVETLSGGYRFCPTRKIAYRTDEQGTVIERCATQHSAAPIVLERDVLGNLMFDP